MSASDSGHPAAGLVCIQKLAALAAEAAAGAPPMSHAPWRCSKPRHCSLIEKFRRLCSRCRGGFSPEVRLEDNNAYSPFEYDSDTGPKSNTNAAGINGYGAFLNVEWDLFDGFERVERLRKKSAEEQAARENLVTARLVATRTSLSQISELAVAAGILAEARFERAEALAIYSTNLAELALAVGSVRYLRLSPNPALDRKEADGHGF